MAARALNWAWNRYRPNEGWLPVLLLIGAIISSVVGVIEVEWVPEDSAILPAAILGLLMGVALAKRPMRAWLAWFFFMVYGLLFTSFWLGRMAPPLRILLDGWGATTQFWRQNGALFLDRMGSWINTAFRGGRSQETIVFAFALVLLAWLLSVYVGWSTFRWRRPLPGLTAMGVAVAVNGFYGKAQIWPAALFVAFTVLIASVMHFANLELEWEMRGVDYSDQIRLDLISHSSVIAMALLFVALATPTIRFSKLSRALLDTTIVRQAEDTLERVFAGVRQPRQGGLAAAGGVESFAGSGGMPRSYLLGDPPELYETVVMTATVTTRDQDGRQILLPPGRVRQTHWRALSYDVYAGQGWARSEEREQAFSADETIPLLAAQRHLTVTQSINWVFGPSSVRYTLGLPLRFDHEVSAHWRGSEDLVWVQGEETNYQAVSRVSLASAANLRQALTIDVPPTILARYTALPSTVPVRVHELAQLITSEMPSAYDQARALEQFLRQYTYSLNVELPPAGVDPVDFFLFEQQEGYCDYYASAMVVMARSLGLPARIGVGFLSQAPDEDGAQTIYQINGHSWAELYFAGLGWVEFEPTAAFPSPFDMDTSAFGEGAIASEDEGDATLPQNTPPIPEPDPRRPIPWQRAGLLSLIILGFWLWWRRRSAKQEIDGVSWAYGRLQRHARRLGHPLPVNQTPNEFTAGFLDSLRPFHSNPWLGQNVDEIRPQIKRLTNLFVAQQYGPRKGIGAIAARDIWRHLSRQLWGLQLLKATRRFTRRD